mgnify:CR=1 FL=1
MRDGVARIRDAFVAAGRDPATLQVRAHLPMYFDAAGKGDLERTIADIPAMLEAGATVVEFEHHPYITDPAQLPEFYARIAATRNLF